MENRKSQILLLLSKKKLNIIDGTISHKLLLKLSSDDDTEIKLFLDNYYNIESMPPEFYKMFLSYIHNNSFKELFDILLRKNIYDLNDKIFHVKSVWWGGYSELRGRKFW